MHARRRLERGHGPVIQKTPHTPGGHQVEVAAAAAQGHNISLGHKPRTRHGVIRAQRDEMFNNLGKKYETEPASIPVTQTISIANESLTSKVDEFKNDTPIYVPRIRETGMASSDFLQHDTGHQFDIQSDARPKESDQSLCIIV